MHALIRVVRPNREAESLELSLQQPRLVGREVGDIVLGDPQCSSRHAELTWTGTHIAYRDLGSTNGSFVDGARVTEKMLAVGQAVTIGACRIEFVGEGGAGRTVVAQPAVGPAGTQVAMRQVALAAKAPAAAAKPQKQPAQKATPKKLSTAAMVVIGAGSLLALVLVWLVAVSLWRGGASGTMSSGEVVVNAVWFRGEPGGAVEGGVSPITVRIAENKSKAVSVGVIEEFAGGTGQQWRTATWQAAFNASRAAGITLVDHEYLVRAGGHIDGPSAGMLITASMLALLNGDNIDKTTTMTGTINPDGSAGPVGGVVQKLNGAKAAGMRRFGYPMGIRNHTDLATMKEVDLDEVGRGLGLEVREIKDLPDAYQFLTGRTLPQQEPVAEAAMQIDTEGAQRLRAKLTTWRGRVEREVTEMQAYLRTHRLGAGFASVINDAKGALAEAETFERSDLPVAALDRYVTAVISLAGTRAAAETMVLLQQRDFKAMQALVLAGRATAKKLEGFNAELKIAAQRSSVGGYVNLTQAMTTSAQAAALVRIGDANYNAAIELSERVARGEVRATPEALSALGTRLALPVLAYLGADVLIDSAKDNLDLVAEEGGGAVNIEALAREAGAYGSAASATLQYFEALVVEPLTERGLSIDEARARIADAEFGYRIAKQEAAIAEAAADAPATQLLRLAAGLDAFLTGSRLVNGYYALGGRLTEAGFELKQRKALGVQLDLARENARRAAAAAQAKAGFIPRAAKLAYQRAGAARDGNDSAKLDALMSYWASAGWSQLAARLTE